MKLRTQGVQLNLCWKKWEKKPAALNIQVERNNSKFNVDKPIDNLSDIETDAVIWAVNEIKKTNSDF